MLGHATDPGTVRKIVEDIDHQGNVPTAFVEQEFFAGLSAFVGARIARRERVFSRPIIVLFKRDRRVITRNRNADPVKVGRSSCFIRSADRTLHNALQYHYYGY